MQENKQEKSPIKQNILRFLESEGVTPYEFYKKSGVTRGILAQNNGISEDNIARFLAYAPKVNPEWLLTGKGEMIRHDVNIEVEHTMQSADANTGIPLIPLSAMAGYLTEDCSVMGYECERYIVPAFQGADFMITIKGTSMFPSFLSGDIVACKKVVLDNLFFQWGQVYVLDTDQGAIVKRIQQSDNKDNIKVVSDNPQYAPFELPITALHSVAIVIGVIRLI